MAWMVMKLMRFHLPKSECSYLEKLGEETEHLVACKPCER